MLGFRARCAGSASLAPGRPLDAYRLGVAFMASAPRGAVELDFEAEERAILEAIDPKRGIDLLVEDSGDPAAAEAAAGGACRACRCCTCPATATMRGSREAQPAAAAAGADDGGRAGRRAADDGGAAARRAGRLSAAAVVRCRPA